MEGLLTPVSTIYKSQDQGKDLQEEDALVEVRKSPEPTEKPSFQANTPAEALEVLKNEPDYDALILTLKYLVQPDVDFDITSPSPLASQLVNALVSGILPNYWSVLYVPEGKGSKTGKKKKLNRSPHLELFLRCLRSVTGLNALLLALKRYIQLGKASKQEIGGSNIQSTLTIILQALESVLEGDETVRKIWVIIWNSNSSSQKKVVWNDFLSLVGSGKILGIAAEAEDVVNDLNKSVGGMSWIADGALFSAWLTSNIRCWIEDLPLDSENGWKCCRTIVHELLNSLVLDSEDEGGRFTRLLNNLSIFEQRNVLYAALQDISKHHLSSPITTEDDTSWWNPDSKIVSGASGLVKLLVTGDESRRNQLIAWLTNSSGAGMGEGVAIRRAVIACIAEDKSDIEAVLDKSIQQFGDQLYIRHTSSMQQDVHAQVLLLAAGYVHRKAPVRLAMMMKSGAHLNAVSNRLAASSPRARFLGMAVGEALSNLVDKGESKMDFKVDEMSTSEANWYKSLVNVADTVGSLDSLRSGEISHRPKKESARASKAKKKPEPPADYSKIISIEEITDDEEEEEASDDDDLVPYSKPESDPDDSDEDPTNITRDKPTAPVYIRDLITYLRDIDNYDRQKLALSTAAPLIRRKANFGTEVSSHAEELATLLVGLQDKYDIEDFQEMRLQGMIAVLIALPLKMGQWYSKTFFDGDYSISQRSSVLTTLGLGARELAGFGKEDAALTASKSLPAATQPSFPSKTLDSKMHAIYSSSKHKAINRSAVNSLSAQLTNTMITPLAASLADKATGPQILKTRTFSSRMAVETARKKPITNSLAKVVADGFFFPLTGRFFVHLKAYGSSSHKNITFDPFLLALFLKTLALLMHASGPNTLSLTQMTSEFWDLLLSLRAQTTGEVGVLEAVLFAMLTLLEVNEDKRGLVEAHGRQLLETQEWVEGVFGRVSGGGGAEEENKVRVLAAGVLVRIRECVEKYQALLSGDLASF
ncbi:Telomere length regulation protein [Venustampulla echinocandica]|uniref:Telomere length regulation protein n=1 Tax=Venustampulla echinocandica TaxID=2656787 RepID=A0A370THR3_9HELO|nr:Telomere length regulation protein [Venustampulla echinocandica]RDL34736.1 Telomere length regulation protein [Venustampulla echinocandica]